MTSSPDGQPTLSERDVQVLRQLAAGRSTTEIARAMSVTTNTVRTRVRRLARKLSSAGRGDLVAAAVGRGLL